MRYDVSLKEIIPGAKILLADMLGKDSANLKRLEVEFRSTRRRQPDLVFETANGSMIHIELQSRNERRMALRVAGYSLDFEDMFPDTLLEHIVLYTGQRPLSMPDRFVSKSGKHRFECRVIDIRQFEGRRLLASRSLQDNLLAILASDVNQRETIRRTLSKLRQYPEKQRGDYLAQLLVLSGMRKLEPLVWEESRSIMPITVDLMKNSIVRGIVAEKVAEKLQEAATIGERRGHRKGRAEGLGQGRALGKASVLKMIIEERFGAIPEWANKKLSNAANEDLDRWARKVLDAASLRQALS